MSTSNRLTSSFLERHHQEALRIKSEANKLFSTSKYPDALQLYTLSLNKNPFDPAVWCNRKPLSTSSVRLIGISFIAHRSTARGGVRG